jgi:hypothetical protein
MHLSVEVKRLKEGTLYICRGYLQPGESSDYLFNLLTRPDQKDVIVDLGELSVETGALPVLALCSHYLAGANRRLILDHAPESVLEGLRVHHGVLLPQRIADRPAAAKAVNGSAC